MVETLGFVALDLGAESGRAILAEFDGEHLQLSESYRFPNSAVPVLDGLYWDVLQLWQEIKYGLAKTIGDSDREVAAIGLDAWGVDFALLNRSGELLGLPHCYRDSRTQGMMEVAFQKVPRAEIFERTGIQFMEINTLYQLVSMAQRDPHALEAADALLMIPDLLNYWLTGLKTAEYAIATTTQCYDLRRQDWARSMVETLGIPARIFLDPVQPGTVLGDLLPAVAAETGTPAVPVVAPACHDTASAFAAIPATESDFVAISSGTWSVLGTELPAPIISPESLQANFTNQGNVCGKVGVLKNVMGLWLVQQCRTTWANQGQEYSYAELTQMAAEAPPFQAVIDPDYGEFFSPGDMPSRIRAYCQATGQPAPEDMGGLIRTILEGLALKYRLQLEQLEGFVGRRYDSLHIVGGGSQNGLLNQLAADATGRAVLAGPVEATALGNVLMQALAVGAIGSLQEGRQLVRRSFPLQTYEPETAQRGAWDDAYQRLQELIR